MQVNVSLGRGH